jgi:hypothetical protein
MVERSFENAYGGTETHKVLSVLATKTHAKVPRRAGKRIHKRAATLNHDGAWSTPSWGSKILPRFCVTKRKAPKKKRPSVDRDGCARIRVSDPCSNRKNIHTVEPTATQYGGGNKVLNAKGWTLVELSLEKSGPRVFTATAMCWHEEERYHKRVTVPRVRNKREAIVALRTIHQIQI